MLNWKQRHRTPPWLGFTRGCISGFQVARLELRAFARTEAESLVEITLKMAVVGPDGIKPCGEEGSFHGPANPAALVGEIAARRRVAPVEAVGQQVILSNEIFRYPERVQDQRTGEAGAVLARGGMTK